jgi:cytochrome o ubiquinol oxidase subunit 2
MSAQFSGDGFADMHFNADAVPADKFTQWVTATRGSGPVLDSQAYADLLKPTKAVTPFTYREVVPNLFNRIASSDDPSRLCLPSQRAEK